MNVGPGGKNVPVMRDTQWKDEQGIEHQQRMHDNGIPKGLMAVLKERGLYKQNMKQEQMVECLSNQPDFKNQKPFLQELFERRGHRALFWPKYHPELSFIEMCWSAWKRLLRRWCDYTTASLKENARLALYAISVKQMRAYQRHCNYYFRAYHEGETGYTASLAVKKYRSHRRILADVDLVAAEAL
jgi:transposase